MVQGSPLLLHNICPASLPLSVRTLVFHPGPFGSGRPVIPTARAVTIARIASPISVDRTYQPCFLRALKSYFHDSKRLVKQGDLIAVGIDTDLAVDESEHVEADQKSVLLSSRLTFSL
jgi:peroxin-6